MVIQSSPARHRDVDHRLDHINGESTSTEKLLPTAFPPLPENSQGTHATERLTSSISGNPAQRATGCRSSILQLAWTLVISAYTGSKDVVFGLCVTRSSMLPTLPRPFRLTISLEHSVDEALTSLELLKSKTSRCYDECGEKSSLTFPNILLIRQSLCKDAEAMVDSPDAVSSYPLSLTGDFDRNGLQISLTFDPKIVSSTMGQIIMEHLVYVLNCLWSHRVGNLGDLLAIGPKGLERIKSWNSRIHPLQSESSVHQVILQRCQERPLAPAVCAWDGNLNYSKLDELSSHLSTRLVKLIPGSEAFVGLLLEKSMWTAVSILAVMKAGHAFFFLDPSLPDQRLKTLCRLSQTPLILTSPKQSSRAHRLGPKSLVAQHECQSPLHSPPCLLPAVNPHQAVYLTFTSGSTGEPKGVVIEHTAVCSGVDAYATSMELNHQSRVFQFASYSFVISMLDHLVALMRGACLCIASETQIQDSLLDTMNACEANWVEITPSVARILDPDSLPSLGTLCLTGESMSRSDLDKWHGKVKLRTCYGQSENSLGALLDTKTDLSDTMDLGCPFASNCWIVDPRDYNRLVPIGAEGELLLEGPSLARGYLHNEEQTRAAFINNPTWLDRVRPGACSRFLRTGDIVRYRVEDGSLQYIGRNGTQVKLRGQRIELTEVEFHLKTQFSTSDAVVAEIVTPSQERSDDAILVAFVTATNDRQFVDASGSNHLFAQPTTEFIHQSYEACSRLHGILPKYMVPTHYVPLTALPLTPSGKLNRRLLRNQAAELGHGLRNFRPRNKMDYHRQPSTDLERAFQGICAHVLSLDPKDINMNETFFEIGGNSITAMQLVNQASEAGFTFRAEQIFHQTSLASLAKHHGNGKPGKQCPASLDESPLDNALVEKVLQQSSTAVDSSNITDIFPCPPTQQWLLDVHEGGCFLIRFRGSLDFDRLKTACERLVETHTALRSLFVRINGVLHQVVLKQAKVPFNIHTTSIGDDMESVARGLCQTDGKSAFRLGIPPLQFMLVAGPAQQHMLILQLSHAQYDGSCQEILTSDLCALYQGQTEAVVPTDYSLYAREVAVRQDPPVFTFWKEILAGSTIAALPYATPQTENILLSCSMEVSIGNPPRGITVASVVKAAWSKVLQEVTGSNDVVFAQLVSMRGIDVPGIYRTVGLCLNRLPVRVQYQPGTTVLSVLHDVQRQHVQGMAFEAAGWDNIVSRSTGWMAGSRAQSLVIHQNFSTKRFFQVEDNLDCEMVEYVAIEPPPECVEVYSELEGDKLRVKLTGPSRSIGESELRLLLEKLSASLVYFTTALGTTVGLSIPIAGDLDD